MIISMPDLLSPQDLEAAANAKGKSMAQVCREARVSPSTFTRWKAGVTQPTLRIYRLLLAAAQRNEVQTTQPIQSDEVPQCR